MTAPLNVPVSVSASGASSIVIKSSNARTRLLYLSVTNNDSAPRYVAIFEATSVPSNAEPKHLLGPIAAGATFVAADGDIGAGIVFDAGITAELVTGPKSNAKYGQGSSQPINVPTVAAGTSANWTAWIQVMP